jgi:hypothetical protein
MSKVAALYVHSGGAYFDLPDVDPWDEERDARLYAGPYPVVAHPPCNKWSPLAYINQRRIPGYIVGDDGGCFAAALEAVRRFGGVLEHPAGSLAWKRYELPRPLRVGGGWTGSLLDDGLVCEVAQSAYGHRARKATWLYYVGDRLPPPLDWRDPETTAIVSGFLHHEAGRYVANEARRVRPLEASTTPPAFRDQLLELARGARARIEDSATTAGRAAEDLLSLNT